MNAQCFRRTCYERSSISSEDGGALWTRKQNPWRNSLKKTKMSDRSDLSEDHFAGEEGAQVGNYTLQNYLGHGSFGVIWGAVGKRVALKIGREEDAGDREVRMLRAMEPHENVIRLHEDFIFDGRLVLVIDRMETDLSEYLHDYHFDRLDAVRQIAYGIRHMSAAGVVHSDLKPENILVSHDPDTNEPVYKIADFGCAGFIGDRTCFYGKTLAYRSPEMCVGDSKAMHPATDVWSFASIVFQLFTDNVLFDPNESTQFSPEDSCESSLESNMEQLALMQELLGPFPKRFAQKHREYFTARGTIRHAPKIKTIDMRAIMVHQCGMQLEHANTLYEFLTPALRYTVRLRCTIGDMIDRMGILSHIPEPSESEEESAESDSEGDADEECSENGSEVHEEGHDAANDDGGAGEELDRMG